jgi:formylmethanofuran dehydrogenase subunit B
MPRTPEGKVKDACVALLNQHAAYYFFPVMGGYGRAGIPDIIACHKGRFLAIECKAGYNKTTPLQEREIAAINKAGGTAMVIREDTLDMLAAWLKGETA